MSVNKAVFQSAQPLNSVSRNGILTLVGFGISVSVDKGHLMVEDGIGPERSHYRLPRIGHRLKRLAVVGSDGLITLAALKWLRDQDVSFAFIERNGRVLSVVGPRGSSDAKLRRSQALAMGNGVGLDICRTLIEAKLQGQESVLRDLLNCPNTADAVSRCRERVKAADSFDNLRKTEASAAASYFREWHDLPVSWPKADLQRIPEHWRFVGSRQSPLTGGPRLAVTPVHAILNYCFALLEAETRLAITCLGLDAGLGLGLHTDTADRSSLVFDVLEPVRPQVEQWLIAWIFHEPLRRADFFESANGNARLMSAMCKKLSATTAVWRKLVTPWCQHVARALCSGVKSEQNSFPPTRLTQQRRIQGKGKVLKVSAKQPKADHLCRGCGKTITSGRTNCGDCAIGGATKRLLSAANLGRVAARKAEARAKHVASRRRHAEACSAWDPSHQPTWLTSEVFVEKIQPLLATTPTSAIRTAIKVSRWYGGRVREGYVPHPRHWGALAGLVGVLSGN